MVGATDADDGFKIALRLHLTGLTPIYRDDLDEWWIYNDKGQFRFRLGKPCLIDPADMNPVATEALVRHSLTEISKGEYLYVKAPTEAFGKVDLPAAFLIDADTVYSSTADGFVYHRHADWATVHDATDGTGVSAAGTEGYGMSAFYANPYIYVRRTFLYFDSSALSGTCTAASEFLCGYVEGNSEVMAMLGTQGATLSSADYDAFSGNSYGSKTPWSTAGYNEIAFNATGLAGVSIGGITKVCNREDPHDFDDSTPGTSVYHNGLYYTEDISGSKDPYLYITTNAKGAGPFTRLSPSSLPGKIYNFLAKAAAGGNRRRRLLISGAKHSENLPPRPDPRLRRGCKDG
jgi:hypothetical protein